MRNPARLPRVLKDSAAAVQTSVPHAQRQADAERDVLEIMCMMRERHEELSEGGRAVLRRRIGELRTQARREGEAAERPLQELSDRHLDWVDY